MNSLKYDNNQTQLEERERESYRNLKSQKNNIIIWALYDDSESSYKKSVVKYLKKKNIEIHSVGINKPPFRKTKKCFYHTIDLSLNNFNLIKTISKISGTPDIILASPPCESWSGADCDGKMFRKIDENGIWEVKNKKFYDEYNKTSHPVKRRDFIQKERGRLIGESTIGGTIQIIKHFSKINKNLIWVIENPKTSKTWEFQKNHWDFEGYMNDTYYSSYNSNFSLKPTTFKSNIELVLKKDRNQITNSRHMSHGSYSQRSSIPEELIKDILDQCLKKLGEEDEK